MTSKFRDSRFAPGPARFPFRPATAPFRAFNLKPAGAAAGPGTPGHPLQAVTAGGSSLLLGFAAVLIVILLARPFDIILVGFRIPLIVCSAAILAVAFTGGLRGLNTRTGRLISLLVIWMVLVTPFSGWKGGSVEYLKSYVLLLVVFFLAVAESPKTLKAARKLMQVVGYSVTLAVIVYAAMGQDKDASNLDYRSGGVGMFGNEGEFALLIGFVLPFWVFTASTIKNRALRLTLMGGGSLYLFWLLVLTGTRSAFVAMIPVCILLLLRLTMVKRMALMVGGVIVFMGILAAAPQRILERLATFSTKVSDDEQDKVGEAAGSAAEREQLLDDALETIARNPFVGVGPGNFTDYRYNVIAAGRATRSYLPAHNTYIQIGAESGILGAMIYFAVVVSVFLTLHVVRKRVRRGDPDSELLNRMTLCLQSALLFFAVMSAFQNCDKYPHIFLIAGLAAALERLTKASASASEPVGLPARPSAAFGPVRRSPAAAHRSILPYQNPA